MSSEVCFLIAFWVLIVGLIGMQIYFASRVRRIGEWMTAESGEIKYKRWEYILTWTIVPLIELALLGFYWFNSFYVPFPDWLRWTGIVLGVASFAFYTLCQRTFWKNWQLHLQTSGEQHLITSGPYSRIRHPIYTAYIFFMMGITLIAENLLFIALLAVIVVIIEARIPKEEQRMIEEYGEEYKAYMQRTGRLFPK